ncbi:MAG: hypothetical protein D6753_03605 [Planctomycetota bacterium]|nr:MAG: hypothetical protein D6753_03605 [Planctomycetota bacterium]
MNIPQITNQQLLQLVRVYWHWRWLWVGSTAAFAGLGLFYVLFLKTDTWVASQGLIIRDEANASVVRLGRFESQTEMKAAQETVAEMARNAQVVADALQAVGREPTRHWFFFTKTDTRRPTNKEVEELAKECITVRAPRGAELGTTELIYLDVKQQSRPRALALNKALCDALERRMQQVRQARAQGVIGELKAARDAAARDLDEATEKLRAMEAAAGADLADLRSLTDATAAGSSTRQALDMVKIEIRQAELQLAELNVDLRTALESFEHPDKLLLTPSKLVNSQPGLKQLREGLAAATIATSQLRGRYTDSHPSVRTALEAEMQIRQQLRSELGVAVETLRREVGLAQERLEKLQAQRESYERRIKQLGEVRAVYANLANEVRARNERLQAAEKALADAEAARDAAMTSSLITRIDNPLIGEKPVGPGRSTIVAGAMFSGLFFGFGVVFLLSPIDSSINYGRRRTDYAGGFGRRASDRMASAAANVDGGLPAGVPLDRRAGSGPEASPDVPAAGPAVAPVTPPPANQAAVTTPAATPASAAVTMPAGTATQFFVSGSSEPQVSPPEVRDAASQSFTSPAAPVVPEQKPPAERKTPQARFSQLENQPPVPRHTSHGDTV